MVVYLALTGQSFQEGLRDWDGSGLTELSMPSLVQLTSGPISLVASSLGDERSGSEWPLEGREGQRLLEG